MGRLNVIYKDKYACFSSIVDDFITNFMSLKDYNKWRIEEYGRHCTEMKSRNTVSIEEVLPDIEFVHGFDYIKETLVKCNIPNDECDKILDIYNRKKE